MNVGDRLRALREEKKLSEGAIEKATGLLRCYISRVKNGHTVPSVQTLEKMARALELPLYRLFYEGKVPLELSSLFKRKTEAQTAWGAAGRNARFLSQLRRCLGRMKDSDRKLLMAGAQKIASNGRTRHRPAGIAVGKS
jgi:transcriptional regulator with XRE-family HTH domain